MAEAERKFIRYHVDGKVGVITIDRPEKRNAMTYAMLFDFIETVGLADDDPATAAIVVTGVPGAFCAGTDLADLATIPGETRGLRGSAEDRHVWWPLTQARKPTVCAIDGPAVGMGAEFTSQCDLRLASPTARFPGTSCIAVSSPTPAPAPGSSPGSSVCSRRSNCCTPARWSTPTRPGGSATSSM
jgi:enoyl-CoA hydratase